ncbi:hypothetical protein GS921_25565 [Rhodococcus hoagii]|nr:hypothetical protein [Prescottella equi]
MDQSRAPLLEALQEYHRLDRYGFSPPGHRQGRGADARVRDVLGDEPFRADVLAFGGLDDRLSSAGYLSNAEKLMAEAVGADQAFFSTNSNSSRCSPHGTPSSETSRWWMPATPTAGSPPKTHHAVSPGHPRGGAGRASRPSGDRLPPQRRRCGHEHPGRLRHLAAKFRVVKEP